MNAARRADARASRTAPDMLTRWIENPQALLPGNAMPTTGLSHDQAAAIADYLYTMDQ